MSWKEDKPEAERRQESKRILEKFPDRIPVILQKSEKSVALDNIDKKKYLVPCDLNIGQFLYVIRKRLNLPAEQAIFLFVNGTIPPCSKMISQIYEEHADQDGFLYLQYSGENTFGSCSPMVLLFQYGFICAGACTEAM